MQIHFHDALIGGPGPNCIVVNNPPAGLNPNQGPHFGLLGVRFRNDQFDGLDAYGANNSESRYGLYWTHGEVSADQKTWQIFFRPGELAFLKMFFFLQKVTGMNVANDATHGPWGIIADYDPGTGKTFLYTQHGMSNPDETNKLQVADDDRVILRITQQANGKLKAVAIIDGVEYFLGESNQSAFLGQTLYPSFHNIKSFKSGVADLSDATLVRRLVIFTP